MLIIIIIFFIYIFILLRLIVIFQTSHNTHTQVLLKTKIFTVFTCFSVSTRRETFIKIYFFFLLAPKCRRRRRKKNFPNYKIVLYVSIAPFYSCLCVYRGIFSPNFSYFFFCTFISKPPVRRQMTLFIIMVYILQKKKPQKKRLVFCIVINKRKTWSHRKK